MDEYCAIMKGMFSIDLDQVGTFSMLARTGFMNINEGMKKEGLANGAVGVEDPLVKDSKGIPVKHLRLPIETRKQRTSQAILALKTLSGGAKLTTNLADVTPKLIILATFNSGNHPFSHLAVEDHGKARFSVQALLQVLHDYREQLAGNVFIGRRAGFMDELENELQEAVAANPVIKYGTVGDAIDNYVNSLNWE
jgi:CRISPR-associated protein Cst2